MKRGHGETAGRGDGDVADSPVRRFAGSARTLALLRDYESRNVTFLDPAGDWPIVWERARGVHVWDAEGKKYLDLTAAFGVAAAGHANPRVVAAGQKQMAKLLHAMGDVHPHALKAQLARELSRITFERWTAKKSNVQGQKSKASTGKAIFCNSGFEAVEAALKTAMLATGKRGVIAFEGAYHGLGYGTLNATHREHFRGPFRAQLGEFGHFVPFPTSPGSSRREEAHSKNRQSAIGNRQWSEPPHVGCSEVEKRIRALLRREKIGAILVEPIQARGGCNIPPTEFLPLLRTLCDKHGALLILDEIYTGFGRTGKWFACEHSGVVPDLICLGKALTGGFPLSACVGRADVMDAAWPPSQGEAIHTSTFLGHPVGCAMALAQIAEIRRLKLVEHSARLGKRLLDLLSTLNSQLSTPRCLGLMAGLELRRADGSPATEGSLRVIKAMLHRGFILLPEGEHGNVISFTPPLTITEAQLRHTVRELQNILNHG
ncbi:MAG: aspartate aminotransferase family protein [Verrucomicrobia bacterium]|nr:MAG: aspartate aminotransferase family protein [Verrucomicrobiota bacterium]